MVDQNTIEKYLVELVRTSTDTNADIKSVKNYIFGELTTHVSNLETRLQVVEQQRNKHIASKFDKAFDYVMLALLAGLIGLIVKWVKG